LVLAIAGAGRDRERLEKLAASLSAPVRFLGRVSHDDLPRLYGCADVSAMMCRNRWGGLEQEGFGIVFVEAAACGVPQIAGQSGGAAEAVAHGETGFVVEDPSDVNEVVRRIAQLLDDDELRAAMGRASRARAIAEFSYEMLATRLGDALGVRE
jgi:phosphatidylinositol alpha-1,6-mannosyltransferase